MFLGAVLGLLLAGCEYSPIPDRPAHWAQPLAVAGVPNCHRVCPGLLRGGAPSPEGVAALKGMGVKTIVNLCHSDLDGPRGRPEGIDEVPIPVLPWRPRTDDVVRFLSLVKDDGPPPPRGGAPRLPAGEGPLPAGGAVTPLQADAGPRPVFVHCRRGADRTGLMVAMYRVCVQDWTKAEAVREMTRGGFKFNSAWRGIVEYVEGADVAELRRLAGLAAAPPEAPPSAGGRALAGRNP